MIELRQVCKSFYDGSKQRDVLSNLNAVFSAGESISILGRSGSGKSTLLHILGGLESVNSGEVTVDGFSLRHQTEKSLAMYRRKEVGFIFQFFNLLPYLTVLENISVSLRMLGLWNPHAHAEAESLLDLLGLADLANRLPEKLSGGEKQRVALVRAMIHKPKLILADEPTGNLDDDNVGIVSDLLFSMVRRQNTTLILVTHDEALARRADRVFQMKEGQLHSC